LDVESYEVKMDGTYSTASQNAFKILLETCEGRNRLEDAGVDGIIILKCIK
jgi:hypothetical protein